MKKLWILCLMLLFSACSSSAYTDVEIEKLKEYEVYDIAVNNCSNTKSVSKMLNADFDATLIKNYCGMIIENTNGINEMIKAGLNEDEIKQYQAIPYFKAENVERYLKYEAPTIEEKILNVNMNMDLDPFAFIKIIENTDDVSILINKFNALPEGHIPSDLVEVKDFLCVQGEDYSCATVDKMMLRKEVADAYIAFGKAALKEGINIRAIATYRSYEYQRNLYNYNLGIYGQEETDKFYARPGQSEHNSGLAVDITFNGHNYTEIENYDGYEWILNNMHTYGFILRYPEDKVHITRYGYESWHLRYVGVDLATELYNNDLTLEEYYAMQ